jgi:hypothetical protein
MILKTIIEKLVDNYVYIYVKNIAKEFAGKLLSLETGIITIEDKNNNLIYIPMSEVTIITERR